jgi:two-component system sensor histidine kinase DegS
MDAQQRLLVMRGQLEKLQSDQSGWLRYVELMKKIEPFLQEERLAKGKRGDTTSLENLINAQEAERQRLSRQMHDGPAQALSNFIVQVEIAARLLDLDPARAKEELAALKTAAMSTFQKVRTFISELRPMMLDDLGVIPTSKRYIDTFREQTGLDVKVDVKGTEKRFENYLEVFVFRGLQELLGTVYRTNQDNPSKVQINVLMIMEDNMVKITVNDNGKGYDPQAMLEGEGLGLKLLKDRVDMLGGTFDIDSAVGKGSRVTMQIPFTSTANA